MKFSVNYSPALARLVTGGQVKVDVYKCPAWPDLLAEAGQAGPVYVHYALGVGSGAGIPFDSETRAPADLDRIDEIMQMTGTPQVNTHFVPSVKHHPAIPFDSRNPAHIRQVIDAAKRDLEPLIHRFGAERVMVENIINEFGYLTVAVLPEVIHKLLEETGCGFLFDLSHARLAAANLGLDPRAYSNSLPVDRMREMHITGLAVIEGELYDHMVKIGDPYRYAELFAGRQIDHFPMQEEDWDETAWAAQQIHAGKWAEPWVAAFEVGGVGAFWDDISTEEMYLEQLPRLEKLVRGETSPAG